MNRLSSKVLLIMAASSFPRDAIILPERKGHPRAPKISKSGSYPCPHCGKPISSNKNLCLAGVNQQKKAEEPAA